MLAQPKFSATLQGVKLNKTELERLAKFFQAFSEPTRLALLQELKQGPKCVNELVAALTTSQANISKQLRILHASGLVDREKSGVNVIYSIREPLVAKLCQLACDKLNHEATTRALSF